MGILHRHLFAAVAGACAAAVALFGFVLIAGQALRDLLGYVMAGQLAPAAAAKLLVLLLPYVAVYALPIGLLTAVLLVLGRMSSQQEITAMRAAGLSLGYIARPVWLIAAAAVLLSLALNFQVMPAARTEYRATLIEAVRQNPLNFIVPKTFVRDFPGAVIYVEEREGAELRGVWAWKLDSQKRVTEMVRARSATVRFLEAEGAVEVVMRDASGETRDRDAPESFVQGLGYVATAEQTSWRFSAGGLFQQLKVGQKVNWMTLGQLRARQAELSAKGEEATPGERRDLTRVRMALSEKAASSFAVLAFALVAVPLGIKVSRKETSANLGLAVALVLGYYFLATLTGMLERSPALRPELWVWAPPLAYAAAGLWLFRRVDRA
jgi:lipopolysaccharide export system permease protein